MKDLSVRIAGAGDAELIADLSRETFYNAFAPFNTAADIDKFMSEVFTREKLIAELSFPDNIFLLAYNNDDIAGYVRMRDKSQPETFLQTTNVLEIARIYTVNSIIGMGVGTALMNACINIAKEKKREYIWLGVWEKNEKAIRFYKRFDFIKFGEHDFVLGSDIQTDWLMALKLD